MPPNQNAKRNHLARFWASASGFWRGGSALTSWPLTIGLLAIAVAQLTVQYRLNYWNRDFFNALQRRDADGLWAQAAIFVPFASLSIGLSVTSVWCRMTTQRQWRQWLTTSIMQIWLARERYRSLETIAGEFKNAEYRISYDAKVATDAPVDLALGFVNSIMTAFVFIGVLWSVGGELSISFGRAALTVPGYLVVGVVFYAFVFTGAMILVGRNLPAIVQTESQAEAELLAAASRIRELGNQASAAGEAEGQTAMWAALRQVIAAWRRLCWQLMGTTMVSQTDLLFAPVFSWVLCAPKYLAGTMTLGELTQASAAFVTVQVAFNWLVDNYQRLSDWRSAVNRVTTLLLGLDEVMLLEREKPDSSQRAAGTSGTTLSESAAASDSPRK